MITLVSGDYVCDRHHDKLIIKSGERQLVLDGLPYLHSLIPEKWRIRISNGDIYDYGAEVNYELRKASADILYSADSCAIVTLPHTIVTNTLIDHDPLRLLLSAMDYVFNLDCEQRITTAVTKFVRHVQSTPREDLLKRYTSLAGALAACLNSCKITVGVTLTDDLEKTSLDVVFEESCTSEKHKGVSGAYFPDLDQIVIYIDTLGDVNPIKEALSNSDISTNVERYSERLCKALMRALKHTYIHEFGHQQQLRGITRDSSKTDLDDYKKRREVFLKQPIKKGFNEGLTEQEQYKVSLREIQANAYRDAYRIVNDVLMKYIRDNKTHRTVPSHILDTSMTTYASMYDLLHTLPAHLKNDVRNFYTAYLGKYVVGFASALNIAFTGDIASNYCQDGLPLLVPFCNTLAYELKKEITMQDLTANAVMDPAAVGNPVVGPLGTKKTKTPVIRIADLLKWDEVLGEKTKDSNGYENHLPLKNGWKVDLSYFEETDFDWILDGISQGLIVARVFDYVNSSGFDPMSERTLRYANQFNNYQFLRYENIVIVCHVNVEDQLLTGVCMGHNASLAHCIAGVETFYREDILRLDLAQHSYLSFLTDVRMLISHSKIWDSWQSI